MRSIALVAIAALGPALVAAVLGSPAPWSWLVAGLALPLGLATRPRVRAAWAPWLVGIVLAGVAAVPAARARHLVDVVSTRDSNTTWPTFDLATDALPAALPEFVAVTGVLRTGIVLDEYAVAPGGIPDQSRAAEAVLVPLAAAKDPSVATRSLVVVRVRPAELAAFADGEPSTLFGRAEPLPPELLATIVDLAGAGARPSTGVLVDTLQVPTPRQAWTAIGLAIGLAIGAAIAHGFALRSR